MATDAEVRAALKQLLDYYAPKEMTPERIAIYRQQLAAMDGGTLEAVVDECITTMTWMPKLNEMFKIASELPVEAEAGNQLRAQAFDLERLRAQGIFIESDWQTLADSFGRLERVHAQQAVLNRMEAYAPK